MPLSAWEIITMCHQDDKVVDLYVAWLRAEVDLLLELMISA